MNHRIPFSPRATFIISIVLVILLGLADYCSGNEFGFFIFYFVPVALVGWSVGATSAYIISVVSAGVWFLADWYSPPHYSHSFYLFWNTAIRFLSFLLIGYYSHRMRELLEQAHDEVKKLSGLLPICAWCKKIRGDEGYWQQIEEYMQQHLDVQFTHGICENCLDKVRRKKNPEGMEESSRGQAK